MSINILPDRYSRVTQVTVAVPVTEPVPALTDPSNGHIVFPERVEFTLRRDEGTPRGDRASAYVAVIGPRRLKSGAAGKPITIVGWEAARNEGPRGYVARPDWLTALLAENLPDGWDPALLELPKPTRYGEPSGRVRAHIVDESWAAPYAAEGVALCGMTLYRIFGPTPDGLAVCEECLTAQAGKTDDHGNEEA